MDWRISQQTKQQVMNFLHQWQVSNQPLLDEFFNEKDNQLPLEQFPLPWLTALTAKVQPLCKQGESPLTVVFILLCEDWGLSLEPSENKGPKAIRLEKLATAMFYTAIDFLEQTLKKQTKRTKRLSHFLKETQLGIYTPQLNQHFSSSMQQA